jgi:hypothetical protein
MSWIWARSCALSGSSSITGGSWATSVRTWPGWAVRLRASDKASDNAPRQLPTERDVLGHRYPPGLRQSDPMRCHQMKPACMVRRRSTVRFRNGAPLKDQVRSSLDSSHPTLWMGAVAVLGGIWEVVSSGSFGADMTCPVGPRGSAGRCLAGTARRRGFWDLAPIFDVGARSQIPAHLTKLMRARHRLAVRQIAIS